MRTTDKQLADVARLDAEATPGPWEDGDTWHGADGSIVRPSDEPGGVLIAIGPSTDGEVGDDFGDGRWEANRDFTIAARTLLPATAADLADLRAAVRTMLAAFDYEGAAADIGDAWPLFEALRGLVTP